VAVLDNSIGPFSFITLQGQRIPPMVKVAIDDRPGVTGSEFTLLAYKGTPFTLVSQVDTDTYDDAWPTFLHYLDATAMDPLELVQEGNSSIVEGNYRVKVLTVLPLRIVKIRGAVGRKLAASPNEGFVEARWDLMAVPLG
jgi:hypothetical protein